MSQFEFHLEDLQKIRLATLHFELNIMNKIIIFLKFPLFINKNEFQKMNFPLEKMK